VHVQRARGARRSARNEAPAHAIGATLVRALAGQRTDLDALERAGTLADDQVAGYRAMAGIVRTYLLEEFALPSRHRTTRELMKALAPTPIVPAGLASAERWLAAADLVKFAAAVDPDHGAAALADARALIATIAAARGGAR